MDSPDCPVAAVFEEHRARLLACVERRLSPALRRRFGADDVLQEAYRRAKAKPLAAVEFLHAYRAAMDSLSDLSRQATADCRDIGRDAWLPDVSSLGFQPVESGTGPLSAAQRAETNAAVHAVLDQLPSEQREILYLRAIDQLSHAEIAKLLNIPEGTAAVRYHRAVRAFELAWRDQFTGSDQ